MQIYADSNLAKMEYDVAVYDDEINNAGNSESKAETESGEEDSDDGQKDQSGDLAESETDDSDGTEALFEKVDNEGMEEITGNFKGD